MKPPKLVRSQIDYYVGLDSLLFVLVWSKLFHTRTMKDDDSISYWRVKDVMPGFLTYNEYNKRETENKHGGHICLRRQIATCS